MSSILEQVNLVLNEMAIPAEELELVSTNIAKAIKEKDMEKDSERHFRSPCGIKAGHAACCSTRIENRGGDYAPQDNGRIDARYA